MIDGVSIFTGDKDKDLADSSNYLVGITQETVTQPSYMFAYCPLAADFDGNGATDLFFGKFYYDGSDNYALFYYLRDYLPTASISKPSGWEDFYGGETTEINWAAAQTGLFSNEAFTVDLYYSVDGGTNYTLIATNETNDGSYDWTIPLLNTESGRIKVSSSNAIRLSGGDETLYSFTVSSTPEVTVVSPNGGEDLSGGSVHYISWEADGGPDGLVPEPISIFYSNDSGMTYSTTIAASIENTGAYAWTVPTVSTTTARIKVTAQSTVEFAGEDASDADFSIGTYDPIVNLLSPNGGGVYDAGDNIYISWEASNGAGGLAADPISLYYSTNSGATYPVAIASSIANAGSYLWTTPDIDNGNVRVKVEAVSNLGYTGSDTSDADFILSKDTGEVPVLTEMKSGPSPFSQR